MPPKDLMDRNQVCTVRVPPDESAWNNITFAGGDQNRDPVAGGYQYRAPRTGPKSGLV